MKAASDSKPAGFNMTNLNDLVKCKPGKGEAAKSLGIALLVIYILVSQIVVPAFQANSAGGDSLTARVTKLEAVVYKLENIPLFVATQTEAISTLKVSVDKLGEKLDRHISRDVK